MIKQLRLHHRNVLQMSFNGFKAAEIAEKLELAETTVYQILNSELGKAYMNGLDDKMKNTTLDVRKELISMNRDALSTFKRLLNPKEKAPASVQFNTAKDILDRSGYKAPDKIEMNFYNKSDEEIDAEIAALEGSINKVYVPPAALQPESGDDTEIAGNDSEKAENAATSQLESKDDHIDPPELGILNDETFDPFNNIKDAGLPNE